MSVESFTDEQAGELFEELFLHYKKEHIDEKEMYDFFMSRGLVVKDRKQLEFLMYKAERAMGWITAGVGRGWKSVVFANTPQDLDNFLMKKSRMKRGKKHQVRSSSSLNRSTSS